MVKPDKNELKALEALKNHPDFETFIRLIVKSMQVQTIATMHIKDDVQVKWSQGRCQELEEILYYIDNAEKLINSIDNNDDKSNKKDKSVL